MTDDAAKTGASEMRAELDKLRAENARLKNALAEKEERVNSLVHGIPDLVWLKDENGVYLNCNHSFELFFGASEEEIVGKTDYDFVDQDLADFFRANDRAAMLADKPRSNEEWVTFASDGRRVLLDTIKTPLRNANGELIGILGVARDITERNQIQDQIELQTQILLTQQETSPDGVVVVTKDLEIFSYNQQFFELWRYPEEFKQIKSSEPYLEFASKQVSDGDKFYSTVKALEGDREQKHYGEVWLKDGRVIEEYSAPIITKNDQYFGRVWYFSDITERKRMEDAVHRSRDFLDSIINNIPNPVFVKNREHRWILLNDALCDLIGHPRNALLGKSDFDFFPEHEARTFWEGDEKVFASEQAFTYEEEITDSDGQVRHIITSKTPLDFGYGEQVLVGVISDITELKQAQDEGEFQRQILLTQQETSPDAILIVGEDDRILSYNQQFIDLWRIPDELLNSGHDDPVLAYAMEQVSDSAAFYAEVKWFYSQKEARGHGEVLLKDGRILDRITAPVVGANNRYFGRVWYFRDITERRRSEEALRVSELRYRAAFHSSIDAVSISHLKSGLLLEVNNQFADVFGFMPDEAVGRTSLEINIWKSVEDRQRLVEAVQRDGKCVDFEAQFRKKTGQIIWGLMSAVAIELEGAPCLFIYTRDITERKQAEEALRVSEERYRTAFQTSPDGISITRLSDGKFLEVNQTFLDLYGYEREEVLKSSTIDIGAWQDLDERRRFVEMLQRDGVCKNFEHRSKKKNGEFFWIELSASAITLDDVPCILTYQKDVSELIKAKQSLEELAQSLERKVEERTAQLVKAREEAEATAYATEEFLAEMSHEIRTPLNAIIGMTYLARSNKTRPPLANYLDQIHASGQHLLEVVNEVLDISKIQAGKQDILATAFSIRTMLDYVIGTVQKAATDKSLSLRMELDPTTPDQLIGDSFRISQILINFLSNAIKFTDQGSVALRVLPLEFIENAVLLRFEVVDTGMGISKEDLPLLFTPYQQLNESESAAKEGTGLGLVISKKLANLMGGRVGVESQAEQGSTFSFEILLDCAEAMPESSQATPPQSQALPLSDSDLARLRETLSGCHVLLAEDNLVNQHVIRELMELVGVKLSVANDGEEALQLLREQLFDVVLMDIRMPKLDGLETTRILRQNAVYSSLPVLALTANASNANRETCIAAGMNDYIQKPVDPETLFTAIERYYKTSKPSDDEAEGEKAAISESDMRLVETLSKMAELDVVAGLNRMMGRKSIYAGLARKIAQDYANMPEVLETALQNHNVEELAHHVHGMKSTLGALGAHKIQAQCVDVERMLASAEPVSDSVSRLVGDLKHLLSQLRVAIEKAAHH